MALGKKRNFKNLSKSLIKNRNKLIECVNCQVNSDDLLKMTTENDVKGLICLKHRRSFQEYLAINDVLAALPQR